MPATSMSSSGQRGVSYALTPCACSCMGALLIGVSQLMEVLQVMKVLQLTEVSCVSGRRKLRTCSGVEGHPANVSTMKRNIPCALVRGFKNDQGLFALVEGARHASKACCRDAVVGFAQLRSSVPVVVAVSASAVTSMSRKTKSYLKFTPGGPLSR
ncbi:hypothetical protein K505DRAFT_13478 [Melanomma pulvis-pyrius CBS 109.77]|uniref:Uncharacterized protein n=1 Tax=Melanomma pulvis-pyrius CBS 109.77 TaxID=1314802 RepID=A0A6A6XG29_9PLEO|nr:hypothetical protein K505DRAFT_13478 [Melanomma pulvis-pyrius CBS 109.77]